MLILVAIAGQAQDRLLRIDNGDLSSRTTHDRLAFFHKEIERLFAPSGTAFGVVRIPSFHRESALSYDSVSHMLIARVLDKSLWTATEDMKRYKAPLVKAFSLTITDQQAQMLKKIWTAAVDNAEDKLDNTLDGTSWEFFIDGKWALTHRYRHLLVKLTSDITDAVYKGNANTIDSILRADGQRVLDRLTLPLPDISHLKKVNTLIVVDGTPLPDSLSNLYKTGAPPNEFFYKHHRFISNTNLYHDEFDTRPFAEKYGKNAERVVEFTTVPDTLCNDYVNKHPEVKKNRRYVEGYVTDDNGKPLSGAFVIMSGWTAGAATDAKGHFDFWLPLDCKTLDAYCDDYQAVLKIKITNKPINIRMKPSMFSK